MTRFLAAADALSRVLKIIDALSRVLAALAMAFLAVLILDMVYEVISRRVFGAPTLWAYDIAYMVNGAGFLFAAGYTLRHNGHIRIDFLATRFRHRTQDGINLVVYVLLVLPALGCLIVGAWREALEAWTTGEVDPASPWKPLLWPFFGALLLGLAALFLQSVAECVRHARSLAGRAPSPLAPADRGDRPHV